MEDITVSAPGKVILHGEHAVVYGKRAIAASLDLRTFLRLVVSNTGYLQVTLPNIKLSFKWSIEDIMKTFRWPFGDPLKPEPPSEELILKMRDFIGLDHEDSDTRHVAGVALLYLYCSIASHKNLKSLDIIVISSLPTSAGLGSSAAFSTCLSAGLLKLNGYVTSAISTDTSQRWSKEDLSLINSWAFQAEKLIHGNPSGIDNSVSTYGGALRFQGGKLTHLESVPLLSVLLFNTKIPRSTKCLVAGVKKKVDKYPNIIKPVLDAMEGIADECEQLLHQLCDNGFQDELYDSLQDLVRMNQHLLTMIGVSHPTIENIVHKMERHNISTKLTGAGGGGCAFALLPPGFSAEKIDNIKKEIQDMGFECWLTQVGGDGVTWHSESKNISDALEKLQNS